MRVPRGSSKRFQEGSLENPKRDMVSFNLIGSQVGPGNMKMGDGGSPEVSLEDFERVLGD